MLPVSIDDVGQVFVRDVLRTPLWRTFLWHSGGMTCKVLEETRETLRQMKARQRLMGLVATDSQESKASTTDGSLPPKPHPDSPPNLSCFKLKQSIFVQKIWGGGH